MGQTWPHSSPFIKCFRYIIIMLFFFLEELINDIFCNHLFDLFALTLSLRAISKYMYIRNCNFLHFEADYRNDTHFLKL